MSLRENQQIELRQTSCPYCGVGCGVDVTCAVKSDRSVVFEKVEGTPEHPANFGRLCVKGSNLAATVTDENRLFHPHIDGKPTDWQTATQTVADKIADVVAQHGPDAVAFYVSGQCLTEDYYIANKLMKGFIGSGNIDTNSRLCMSSAVAAYKRAFGEDIVPCNYEDLELTDLIVLIGSNAAWTHPVLYQRMERAKLRNPALKVVVVDPRRNASCELADLHLAIRPGTDAALFNGLLAYLEANKGVATSYVAANTQGFTEALAQAKHWTLEKTAHYCDVAEADLRAFYQWFCQSPTAVSFYSMGINQSTTGVDKANAIINCHLASGKIGQPGSGPFSITGQPNAMGGREVGGLANMLAAHMDIHNPEHHQLVSDYWQAPNLTTKAGLKAVDLFEQMDQGKIKFVWIMATNPVVSMPNRELIERALTKCDTVVVSEVVAQNDTMKFADIALPATGWSEKDGTVTNSERRISRQRGIMPPRGEAKHDWQIMCEVAQKLGYGQAFNFSSPKDIFNEYAAMTAYKNDGQRALNLSGLMNLSQRQYDNFKPIQWPVTQDAPNGTERLLTNGKFYTPSGKAQFIAITPQKAAQQTSLKYPFILNTGRMRDQWHTMTRTGNASVLLKHTSHASLAMHPQDRLKSGFSVGQLVALSAASCTDKPVILPVEDDSRLRRFEVFVPIHWSETWGSHCAVAKLFNGANDAISGQPELKHGAVALTAVNYEFHGALVVKDKTMLPLLTEWFDYWAHSPLDNCATLRFARTGSMKELREKIVGVWGEQATITSVYSSTHMNLVIYKDDVLIGALWMATLAEDIALDWLDALFAKTQVSFEDIQSLLNNTPSAEFLQGPVVCSCFEVREKPIVEAIAQGCTSVDSLGKALKCGTNCGSCRSELGQLIKLNSQGLAEQKLSTVGVS
jgi:assimilatory nitrate reductase catalytic subunit